ncbi:sigma-70 family RNA polymerase sigma factor [Actinomycetospora sp. TBRC 11914]|uniref:sigma-70 family RNA polymerase sigma factor n=1 Tax=Actinomycetospora sp. TBRC 11914 TaxID=2729387 RepID=UPI001B7D5224|nr:sigma-70 family RNA polymerase sigma factor [Actinomycetospora sp. TBRC 11914]
MVDGGVPEHGPATGDEPAGPSGTDARSDAELLADLRGRPADHASSSAFATLYDRHRDAARGLARQLARSPSDADDLVSAAFARLLEILRAGGGPTEAFRAYLLTSLRHLAYDRTRAERRLDLTEDMGEVIGIDPERTVIPFTDPAVAGLERSLAARAFATLPERWQAVLWHLEVEGDSPADIAPLFGLTANAVSALGYRAREGLRQAYLQEHLAGGAATPPRDRRHRETEEKLGAYTRGGLSKRDAAKVEEHLRECAECRALAGELREVNSGILRSTIAPLVLGAALVGYLADRAAPGVFTGAWPTTAEWVVAGGGVLGVLGAVGGVARAAEVPRARRLGIAAVGLAGLGVATATALGQGPTTPEAAPPTSVAVPGAVVPGAVVPGAVAPGAVVPGAVAPGSALPGPGLPGTPTRPPPTTAPASLPTTDPPGSDAVEPDAPPRRSAASSPEAWRTGAAARPADVPASGTVTAGTWTSGASARHATAVPTATARPGHDDPVGDDRTTRTSLVGLRVVGLGLDVRAARRGPVEPALDVVLR